MAVSYPHLDVYKRQTQNPVETQGTFPLPEAQLDRFLMRIRPGYPSREESVQILERFIRNDPLAELAPVAAREEPVSYTHLISQISVEAITASLSRT